MSVGDPGVDDASSTPGLVWFDNHCHIDDERIPGGTDGCIDEARAAGVDYLITVGTDATRSEAAAAVARAHDRVWATVGLHPHDAVDGLDDVLPLLDGPKVVAVGECGLDYYYEHSPRAVQMEIFARQIGVANERDLPLVIHTRDAWEDTFEILDREGVPANTIFHCFTGGPDELDDCVARGGFISFSGIVTFPSASELRLAALRCPLDRMLIETDAPYLAPVPFRGQRNRPAWVTAVGAGLADLRGDDLGTIASATVSNAFRAFRLDQYSE